MKSVRYHIEVYAGEETQEMIASFAATDPFLDVQPGALLALGTQDEGPDPAPILRVVEVLHVIEESDCIVHRLRVHARPDGEAPARERGFAAAAFPGRARDRVRDLAGSVRLPRFGQSTAKMLDEYAPIIRELVRNRLGSVAKDALRDDDMLDGVLRNVYQLLPVPVRLALKEESFVGFCLRHRDRYLAEPVPDAAPAALPEGAEPGGAGAA